MGLRLSNVLFSLLRAALLNDDTTPVRMDSGGRPFALPRFAGAPTVAENHGAVGPASGGPPPSAADRGKVLSASRSTAIDAGAVGQNVWILADRCDGRGHDAAGRHFPAQRLDIKTYRPDFARRLGPNDDSLRVVVAVASGGVPISPLRRSTQGWSLCECVEGVEADWL